MSHMPTSSLKIFLNTPPRSRICAEVMARCCKSRADDSRSAQPWDGVGRWQNMRRYPLPG